MSDEDVKPRCRGTRKNGQRCRATLGLSADTQLCQVHDPARTEHIRAIRSAGARALADKRAKLRKAAPAGLPRRPKSQADAAQWCAWALLAVATGELDPRQASAIASLARAFAELSPPAAGADPKALRAIFAAMERADRGEGAELWQPPELPELPGRQAEPVQGAAAFPEPVPTASLRSLKKLAAADGRRLDTAAELESFAAERGLRLLPDA